LNNSFHGLLPAWIATTIEKFSYSAKKEESKLVVQKSVAVPILDPARFVAAAMVVLYHYCAFFRIATPDGTARPYPQLLPIAQYGYLGVQLFFMISGFVIFRSASKYTASGFISARIRRLYPAFLVCCCLTWIVVTYSKVRPLSPFTFLYGLTMFNGVIDTWRGAIPVYVDGAYWTLTVEWKFYMLVLLLITLRRRVSLEFFLWAWLCVSVVYLAHPLFWLESWLLAPWAPYFVAGAAAHLIQQRGWQRQLALLGGASLSISVWHTVAQFDSVSRIFGLPGNHLICAGIIVAMYIFMFGPVARRMPLSPTNSRVWILAGAVSYPVYLLHEGIGGVALDFWWTPTNRWMFLVVAFTVVLLSAWFIHEFVERKIWALLAMRTRYLRA